MNGKIPESIGKLKELKVLDLGLNELVGSIPTSIGGLKNIKKLDLHSNTLTGNIPVQIGHLSEVTELLLGKILTLLDGSQKKPTTVIYSNAVKKDKGLLHGRNLKFKHNHKENISPKKFKYS